MPALPPPQAVNAGCEVNAEVIVSVCPQDRFLLYSQALTPLPSIPGIPPGFQEWFSSFTPTSIH